MKQSIRVIGAWLTLLGGVALADDATTQPAAISAETPITMHMNSVTPRDALDELKKQSGVSVDFWPENLFERNQGRGNGPVSSIDVDIDHLPFWVALQKIADAAQLTPTNMGRQEITLQWQGRRDQAAMPTFASPTASVALSEIHRNHSVSFQSTDQTPHRSCGANIQVYLDPRLHAMKYDPQVQVETADDENKHSVAATSSGNSSMQSTNPSWMIQGVNIPLDYDPATSHKLATLKGTVHVMVASEVQTLEIDDLANAQGTTKTIGGMDITIDEVKANDKSLHMKFILERNDMGKEQWEHVQQTFYSNLHLVKADGKTVNGGGGGGGNDKKLQYEIGVDFQSDADKPVKVVWDVPVKFEDIDVPFEFHDLTLP